MEKSIFALMSQITYRPDPEWQTLLTLVPKMWFEIYFGQINTNCYRRDFAVPVYQ